MERLKRMSVFAKVVEFGSFTAAARQLQMSVSSISQTVSKLEDELQEEETGKQPRDDIEYKSHHHAVADKLVAQSLLARTFQHFHAILVGQIGHEEKTSEQRDESGATIRHRNLQGWPAETDADERSHKHGQPTKCNHRIDESAHHGSPILF